MVISVHSVGCLDVRGVEEILIAKSSFGAEINLAGSKCGAHVDRVTVPEITGCSSRIPTLFQPS